MPVYEYVCQGCSQAFEELVFGSAVPVCPRCGEGDVEKQYSSFATRSAEPPRPVPGACGTCGDPRGQGACAAE